MTKQGKNDANVWCDILNNVHGYSMFLVKFKWIIYFLVVIGLKEYEITLGKIRTLQS